MNQRMRMDLPQFHPLHTDLTPPQRFTYPFCYEPHPLCVLAAEEVKRQVAAIGLKEGKMLGVLVVTTPTGELGFLAAYSGLMMGSNDWPWFVPPVFDATPPDGHFKQTERQISALNEQLRLLPPDSEEAAALKARRKQLSEQLQLWLFDQYHFLNGYGQERPLVDVWQDYHCSARIKKRYPLPPGGTGDCCAPKLLQFAYRHGLTPRCMAEFWWGPSPKTDIRHHGQFYPACRGKCKPVLTWMMKGLKVDVNPETLGFARLPLTTVYEDSYLLVVNKPSGMLSIPGRVEEYSVTSVMKERYPESIPVHRLDMWTSGLLVVAKNREVHAALQEQFVHRTVSKRYVALLEGALPADRPDEGRISLPLYADPINRPRQIVDYERGKTAITEYRVVSREPSATRISLFPHTGRTHQLRIHCAHPDGLNCPIRGDELYGHTLFGSLGTEDQSPRLCLHAEYLALTHPLTGERMEWTVPPAF